MTPARMWFLIARAATLARPCPSWIHRWLDSLGPGPSGEERRNATTAPRGEEG